MILCLTSIKMSITTLTICKWTPFQLKSLDNLLYFLLRSLLLIELVSHFNHSHLSRCSSSRPHKMYGLLRISLNTQTRFLPKNQLRIIVQRNHQVNQRVTSDDNLNRDNPREIKLILMWRPRVIVKIRTQVINITNNKTLVQLGQQQTQQLWISTTSLFHSRIMVHNSSSSSQLRSHFNSKFNNIIGLLNNLKYNHRCKLLRLMH